jgi:hypothetical protein
VGVAPVSAVVIADPAGGHTEVDRYVDWSSAHHPPAVVSVGVVLVMPPIAAGSEVGPPAGPPVAEWQWIAGAV